MEDVTQVFLMFDVIKCVVPQMIQSSIFVVVSYHSCLSNGSLFPILITCYPRQTHFSRPIEWLNGIEKGIILPYQFLLANTNGRNK